ncbi:myeloblastin-like [Cimex lectularius]|uniref:Peptidase S1 domain-containing protein n=1 Tax=Cimex lectularius TaxID=79782 RepID=A0A8I6SPY9_CIMLE|nr:myeloblastin-like [Cimex lectularius]
MLLQRVLLLLLLSRWRCLAETYCDGIGCVDKQSVENDAKPRSNIEPSFEMIGGRPAEYTSYPYIVSIQEKATEKLICNGIIISASKVMTGCHCVAFVQPIRNSYTQPITGNRRGMIVVAGARTLFKANMKTKDTQLTQYRFLSKIDVHPKCSFGQGIWKYDFSIITVRGVFNFNRYVGLAPIDTAQNSEVWAGKIGEIIAQGKKCKAVGFGRAKKHQEPALLEIDMILSDNGCRDRKCWYRTRPCKQALEKGVCGYVDDQNKPELCTGDAAAALICDNKVLALLTKGPWCNQNSFIPSLFTRLDMGLDFYNGIEKA